MNFLCTKKKLYHRGNAAFRARTATSRLKIIIRTEASRGSGTTSRARVTLYGAQRSQSFEIGRASNSPGSWGRDLTFEPGSSRTFTVECPELGPLSRLEISHDDGGASATREGDGRKTTDDDVDDEYEALASAIARVAETSLLGGGDADAMFPDFEVGTSFGDHQSWKVAL